MPFHHPAALLVSTFMSLGMVTFASMDETTSASTPSTYLLDGPTLMETRSRTLAGDPALVEGIKELRSRADRHMSSKLWSVIDKPFAGPSGDKRDYLSLAPFFWPDPATSTGLPYILRDGEYNPETREYDRTRLDGMCEAVHTLALAYYLTGEERYTERAIEQIRVWFINEKTRMKPHLTNAQFVRGKNEGNPWGLIETEQLARVVDGVALLRTSKAWLSEKEDKKLREWFVDYLNWLQTSELGKMENGAPNNHGIFFDFQATVFALFIGRNDLAREILENVKTRRIPAHIEPDGSQPQELARTRGWSYSQLNLLGMFRLAILGEHVGVDLWNYQTPDGRSIRKALDWMFPYAIGKPWEHKQITRFDYETTVWLFRQAAIAYKEPTYEQAIAKLPGVERELVWINLLHPDKAEKR